MPKYNGHANWNAWNISLWLNNDEAAYHAMRDAIACTDNRAEAAERIFTWCVEYWGRTTPDGAPWTVTNIRRAMVGQ